MPSNKMIITLKDFDPSQIVMCISPQEYSALKEIARIAAKYGKSQLLPDRRRLFKLAKDYAKTDWPTAVGKGVYL